MRLKTINVHRLFGIFDHVIPLNADEHITIIHGPNGYGKTAILRLIHDIFSSRHTAVRELPFERIVLEFDVGPPLTVRKVADPKEKLVKAILYECPDQVSFELSQFANIETQLSQIENYIPGLNRIAADEWFSVHTGESMGIDELIERFGDRLPEKIAHLPYPDWLASIRDSIDVHFIRATRLETARMGVRPSRRKRRKHGNSVVGNYSEELSDHIHATLSRYAELSQSLDRSFPQRLVGAGGAPSLSMELIRERLAALEQKRKRLTEAGLLDAEAETHFDVASIDATKAEVLSLYISDVEQKLAVFDNLYARIDVLKTILNRRFSFKTARVDKNDGLEFFTTDNGAMLSPEHLSSGEQHEVVLLYQLLFRVKPQSLILIDEPELSLHIAWQEQFLEDLAHITSISSFDVLVATHSPQIISERWDLTVELKGPKECASTSPEPALQTR